MEGLAVRAKSDPDCLPELWERVRRFIWRRANRVYQALGSDCLADMDDLVQSGFLGLLKAVDDFDPEAGTFFSCLVPRLQTAFAECTGYRTQKQKRDPARTAVSLDAPLSDDNEQTLADTLPSPMSGIEEADERIYSEWLHNTLETALSALPADQQAVLKLRHYAGLTAVQVAERLHKKPEDVRKLEQKGLAALRKPKVTQTLDLKTDFYRRGPDPVLENVLWREQLEERIFGHGNARKPKI